EGAVGHTDPASIKCRHRGTLQIEWMLAARCIQRLEVCRDKPDTLSAKTWPTIASLSTVLSGSKERQSNLFVLSSRCSFHSPSHVFLAVSRYCFEPGRPSRRHFRANLISSNADRLRNSIVARSYAPKTNDRI